ncbi:MAG: hypothetical protein EPN33_10640 [Acidobacteria bacterium]|nr:MAG: hypothetical protein EPN33_10640 [Acidobacteriota bacterium]
MWLFPQPEVELTTPAEVPLLISDVRLEQTLFRRPLRLHYALTNTSGRSLRAWNTSWYFQIRRHGQLEGAPSTCTSVVVAPHKSGRGYFAPGTTRQCSQELNFKPRIQPIVKITGKADYAGFVEGGTVGPGGPPGKRPTSC